MSSSDSDASDLDTSRIKEWRSIVTLIVFVFTNIVVLFPFHIPIYVPRVCYNLILDALSGMRVIAPRRPHERRGHDDTGSASKHYVRFRFPMNLVTAPLIADLFLLAILAIGRQEVHDGTIGAHNISPIDIMVFFLTLAYIAISIDASGLIRYLAFKVLQKSSEYGHRLFLYLYVFFFALGSFIGNDPIILTGTAFLAYMTRVSSNIVHPRAWIHSQFAIANIASAILVSSNPTNLVLAGAFSIRFINYTANMIVPVVASAIVLFPFLLYINFADEDLIPLKIKMHELSEEAKAKAPVNPNIPNARGNAEEQEKNLVTTDDGEQRQLLSLEEIMNPFLDKKGAAFGAVIMAATLITLLALNASSQSGSEHPVFWVTLPAAFVMFCFDIGNGWLHRHETREIAQRGRKEIEDAKAEEALRREEEEREARAAEEHGCIELTATNPYHNEAQNKEQGAWSATTHDEDEILPTAHGGVVSCGSSEPGSDSIALKHISRSAHQPTISVIIPQEEFSQPVQATNETSLEERKNREMTDSNEKREDMMVSASSGETDEEKRYSETDLANMETDNRPTLVSLLSESYRWSQETFPTVAAVVTHLPFALVPFGFAMFVLVQALVTKGWVPVFAYGWDHWVNKTGTVGAVGGMGFLAVILCNFAGTNIGTAILLSRIIQAWQEIHNQNGIPISERTFWATVYAMAIGVNYGAFSTAFSASLAGLLWRDILARKHIPVRSLDFALVNLPIIAVAMAVGCTVLIGEVYIIRGTQPYDA